MNIGMQELLVISVLALIVLGPERLPGAIRSVALWTSRLRRGFNEFRATVEHEINADEIRQQIHNETVLHELGETREALESFQRQANAAMDLQEPHAANQAGKQVETQVEKQVEEQAEKQTGKKTGADVDTPAKNSADLPSSPGNPRS